MNQCTGFAPVSSPQSNILILGSMPGIRSLTLHQYYAHPQNRFWPIIAAVCNAGFLPAAYEDKLQILHNNQIALWDVLALCERSGSLDSAISDEEVNDFSSFLQTHPHIKKVCFNGGKAQQLFNKHDKLLLNDLQVEGITLPSTSPANARWRLPALIDTWRAALLSSPTLCCP